MDQDRMSDLDAHLGYWLRFVSNYVSHAFHRRLDAQGVTVAEWVVLRQLFDQDGLAPSVLAEQLGMTRGAISKLVDRLAAKSLVRKATSERDRRYQAVALTPAGRELVPQLVALADENDRAFFGVLRPSEQQTLRRLLQELVRAHGFKQVPTD